MKHGKWAPCGHGKCIISEATGIGHKYKYVCYRCGKEFTKEEIDNY